MPAERLQKLLARSGVASRRAAEGIIQSGRVRVDGVVVTELGVKADLATQVVTVDGRALPTPAENVAFLLNKPQGVLSTCHDPKGRKTVLAYTPFLPGLHPVGRLDKDTSGLLILTNDGDFTLALTHPRHGVPKTYFAELAGRPESEAIHALRSGVMLDDGRTRPAEVELIEKRKDTTILAITLREGKNRQIRRMADAIGHPVVSLERVAIGPMTAEGLPPGAVRRLTADEMAMLRKLAHSPKKGAEGDHG